MNLCAILRPVGTEMEELVNILQSPTVDGIVTGVGISNLYCKERDTLIAYKF